MYAHGIASSTRVEERHIRSTRVEERHVRNFRWLDPLVRHFLAAAASGPLSATLCCSVPADLEGSTLETRNAYDLVPTSATRISELLESEVGVLEPVDEARALELPDKMLARLPGAFATFTRDGVLETTAAGEECFSTLVEWELEARLYHFVRQLRTFGQCGPAW